MGRKVKDIDNLEKSLKDAFSDLSISYPDFLIKQTKLVKCTGPINLAALNYAYSMIECEGEKVQKIITNKTDWEECVFKILENWPSLEEQEATIDILEPYHTKEEMVDLITDTSFFGTKVEFRDCENVVLLVSENTINSSCLVYNRKGV